MNAYPCALWDVVVEDGDTSGGDHAGDGGGHRRVDTDTFLNHSLEVRQASQLVQINVFDGLERGADFGGELSQVLSVFQQGEGNAAQRRCYSFVPDVSESNPCSHVHERDITCRFGPRNHESTGITVLLLQSQPSGSLRRLHDLCP